MKLTRKLFLLVALLLVFLPALISGSELADFEYITIDKVSRYTENRIAFQHVDIFNDPLVDDSAEALLIIRDSKIRLIIDGYDDPRIVKENRLILDQERKLYDDQSMWINKMNGKPDAIIATDRRVEVMKSFDETFVSEKFGTFYKNIRDKFLQRHVDIFLSLMTNRRDAGLLVKREPLPIPFHLDAPDNPVVKYKTTATAKTSDGRIYYCEDADGDGVTETFTVTLQDGFDWGYKSGPNIIFIYNNSSDDLKGIIGELAHNAYYGTTTEKEEIEKTTSEQDDIMDWIEKDLVLYEEFYQ